MYEALLRFRASWRTGLMLLPWRLGHYGIGGQCWRLMVLDVLDLQLEVAYEVSLG